MVKDMKKNVKEYLRVCVCMCVCVCVYIYIYLNCFAVHQKLT